MLSLRREFAKTEGYPKANEKICEALRSMAEFQSAENVMIYLPLGGEADIRGLYSPEKNFFIPVTEGVIISAARYTPDMKLKKGEWGVYEPVKPIFADKSILDFIAAPAVAADKAKNRMGFGKGCYDRFLDGLKCAKAAVCFSFQVTDALDAKPHDVKMDYIVTEDGCF